jgi:response regulator RpfG family c-di-GMP phosphodiesterase
MSKSINNNSDDNDDLLFIDEEDRTLKAVTRTPWKILIVDDEQEIHNVTKMVLRGVTYKGKGLQFLHAYTAKSAVEIISENSDTAIILLDVVMEQDDAGLNIIHTIREDLNNKLVRIIIRTGQPGQAPEKKVIVDYDINDYREKTELTSQKLFSTVIASLRAYENILTIDMNRKGLEKIIEASTQLFEIQSADRFAYEVLEHLRLLLLREKSIPEDYISGFVADVVDGHYIVSYAIGKYKDTSIEDLQNIITADVLSRLDDIVKNQKIYYFDNNLYIGYFKSKTGHENIIYLEGRDDFNQSDKYLIEILGSNISSIYDNIYLTKEIEDTQREILYTLGEVVETRSHETYNHVNRVAEYCKLLALKYGLSAKEAKLLKQASPMHDIGKVGILDSILSKPAALSKQEFNIVKKHTTIGYNIFKTSDRELLKAAATIALQHHERWDGTGYPRGMEGTEIHIFGRITCLADIFDALGNKRVYKNAWALDEILKYIKQQKGKIFDPDLVDIFFENLDEILEIRDRLSSDIDN